MKYTTIALAVAATLATSSAMAAAVTQADIAAARTAKTLEEVWFAGASASVLPAFLAFEKLCDAGSTAIWSDSTSTSAVKPGSIGNYLAYACRVTNPDDATQVTTRVLYNNTEGSAVAYGRFVPTTNAYSVASLKRLSALDTISCSATNVGSYSHKELLGGTTVATPVTKGCTAAVAVGPTFSGVGPKLPDAGFTDVESSAWGIDASTIGAESDANLGQVFGVAVSTNLYRALQVAQGITETGNTFDPAKAPSITKAQYGAIVQNPLNGYQKNWANLIPGSTKPVYLTRRTNASGTQSSSNIFFLGNPCNKGNAGEITPKASGVAANTDASFSAGQFHVYEGSGTGNVKTWLTTRNNAGDYAIGVISLENDWRSETDPATAGYRFLKIDGVSPEADVAAVDPITTGLFGSQPNLAARATAVDGSYPFHMEMKYFVPTSSSTAGTSLMESMVAALASPEVCTLVPRGITLNAASGTGCVGSSANVVVKVTKNGNNCSSPLFY